MTQPVGVVGVFVAGNDLVDALAEQEQRVVAPPLTVAAVAEPLGQVAGQMMAFVEGPQRQQAGVAGDLAAGKITLNRSIAVEARILSRTVRP